MDIVKGQSTVQLGSARLAALHPAFGPSAGLWDQVPVALCMCDRDGQIVRFNRRAGELWGGITEPGLNICDELTRRLYHPDGRPISADEMPITSVLATGMPVLDQIMILERRDGTRVTVLWHTNPLFDDEDRTIGAILCFQDISEQRRLLVELSDSQQTLVEALQEKDQRLAVTYEHAGIGIAETDSEGRFLSVNEALCALTGFTRAEMMSHSLFDLGHPEDAGRDRINYRQQVAGGYDRYSIEKRMARKDGSPRWLSVLSTSVRDAAGTFLYSVRVVQDITEQKQAGARNKALLDEMTHRVKNTLATVQTLAAHTLRDAGVTESVRRTFDARLAALGRTHEHLTREGWESADLEMIVRDILDPFRSVSNPVRLDGKPIKLQPQAAVTIGFVLHELASNAAKYGALSTPGGAIDLTWVIAGERQRRLYVEWRETGGPEVKPPERQGFGSRLLEWGIIHELSGVVAARYEPAGFSCRLDIPLASIEG